ncbi:MAG: DUF1844 domain-containing protein [Pseudomonadota bacterium]|uniref:DUF1844 domain-containing protein n=1 Tax=Candidatus Desulfatibia profunda TaxID=2841695 RepID=A0A8J6NPR3_9BACT|nr:DUF1844 domain-containing protein [Candidatus Desulfatibia profunda]MBL7179199.1 DUF1844 domain-containing protein [Desulfobacterales bacterium]
MPEKKDFIIKDKRIFSEEDQDTKHKEKAGPSKKEGKKQESQGAAVSEEPESNYQLPEINFPTFIFSLNSSALVHLGIIDDPASGKKVKNLAFAKQTIDILGMLEEKARGNLTKDEESMLKNILYDLRILYVKEKG